jgi:four helix bundle protein
MSKQVGSFRDLLVWQRSMELAVAVYTLTRGFPKEELHGMTSQMRRASISIASNIAEGKGRNSQGEFRQFLGVARGSAFELQTQLLLARRLEFCSESATKSCLSLAAEVERMIGPLIATLQ